MGEVPGAGGRISARIATNAYRVLGLPATATSGEIQEAVGSIRRAAKLGVRKVTRWDLAEFGSVSRSDNDIRGAAGRLANPLQRLWERQFWFHGAVDGPQSHESRRGDGRDWRDVAAAHDAGLKAVVAVCIQDPAVSTPKLWIDALTLWANVRDDDEYWEHIDDLEGKGGFEPRASSAEAAEVRDQATVRVLSDLASVAKDGLVESDYDKTKNVLQVVRGTRLAPTEVTHIEEDILGPLEERLEKLCADVRQRCVEGVTRDEQSASNNHHACEAALGRFDQEVMPALEVLLNLVDDESEMATRARGVAALCLHGIAIDFNGRTTLPRPSDS